MAAASPPEQLPIPLARIAPFDRMDSSRRKQLLARGKPFTAREGEMLFPENEVPDEVYLIADGTIEVSSEILAEPEPVLHEVLGAGAAIGWTASLSGAAGTRAAAVSEVSGLRVPMRIFLDIARNDPVLREELFARAGKGEVWRAVLAEMERRTGRIVSAKEIVEKIHRNCVAREWPDDEDEIAMTKDRVWVVTGGEGTIPGERWTGGEGVLWARLIGLPEPGFTTALLAKPQTSTVTHVSAITSGARSGVSRPGASVSEMPVPAPNPSPYRRQRRNSALRVAGMLLTALALLVGAVASWASRQSITERISVPGHLAFSGDSRTLTTGVAGVLSEFNIRANERLQSGATLAIVKPPLDEDGARATTLQIGSAERDLAFLESIIAGAVSDESGVSEGLVDLAREQARLGSDLRVLHAIAQGGPDGSQLSAYERTRVVQHLSKLRSVRDDRIANATRDTSSRFDELREAENAYRQAQDDVNAHVRAFSGASTGDKDSAEQEIRDYKRVLAAHNRNLSSRRDTVNRIRKDIAAVQSAVAAAQTAEPPPDMSAEILKANNELATIDEEIQRNRAELKAEIVSAKKHLDKIQADAAPRQIQALQPGYVIEASKLTAGTIVRADTILGRVITRQAWQIECDFPTPDAGRIERGQELSITIADRYATLVYDQFAPVPGSPNRVNIRDSRDDWQDGLAVRVETTIITGSLLDEWMRIARIALR